MGREGSVLLPQFEAAHFDEVLGDFGYSLLALVYHEARPVEQLFVDLGFSRGQALANEGIAMLTHLLESFGVVIRQLNLLPHVLRCVRSFNGLDIQVQNTCTTRSLVQQAKLYKATGRTFMFANGGISRVGKRTALPITKTGYVVLISAEVLRSGPTHPY